MFSFVFVLVPATATLSVVATQDGRKMLVVKELGIRLWGEAAVKLARLHKIGQDAVLTGYLRPLQGNHGTFPTVTITSVQPANGPASAPEDLETLLNPAPSQPAKAPKSVAEQLR